MLKTSILYKVSVLAVLFVLSINVAYGAQWRTVKYVIDGDTVVLSNGEKVRLLGINTPELNHHKDKAEEAGATEAKQWLIKKVLKKSVRLEKGVQHTDRYGRTLAYLINSKGDNINLMLVEQGFATMNIFPPNLDFIEELTKAQTRAEQNNRGLWKRAVYQPQNLKDVNRLELGRWGRYKASIVKLKESRKGSRLWLTSKVYVWVSKKNLAGFSELLSYKGKAVEVRGWLKKRGKYWSINVRHPSQIIILDAVQL